jgi:hypothetical protein
MHVDTVHSPSTSARQHGHHGHHSHHGDNHSRMTVWFISLPHFTRKMVPTKQAGGMNAYRTKRLVLQQSLVENKGTKISTLMNLVNRSSEKDTMQLYREILATQTTNCCCYGHALPCCHVLAEDSHLDETPIQIRLETLEVN